VKPGAPIVVKIGGELLEDATHLKTVVSAIAAASRTSPLVVTHGGGREIDAALKSAGIEKRQVDGLRITDEATLDVVVSVLAGTVNTRFVAALGAAGVSAVGLTGADGRCGLSRRVRAHRSVEGATVDLGCVGVPSDRADAGVLRLLIGKDFVPVVACIGVDEDGRLLNVNADTFAGHLAGNLRAERLVIAGTTPGVLGPDGATVPLLESTGIADLVSAGTATAGMIAKLRACEHAAAAGVDDVVIVDGRSQAALEAALAGAVPPAATRVTAGVEADLRVRLAADAWIGRSENQAKRC
jgi:acetylglutamate kinase